VLFVTARSGPEQFVGSFLERIPGPETAQLPNWDWPAYRDWHRRTKAPRDIGYVVGRKTVSPKGRKSWIVEKDYTTDLDTDVGPMPWPLGRRIPVKIKK
jgi:hypothetical protein